MIFLFASKDDKSAWSLLLALKERLTSLSLPVRIINKLSSNLEDLSLIARYKVLHSPTVLIVKNDEVTSRFISIPSLPRILKELTQEHST